MPMTSMTLATLDVQLATGWHDMGQAVLQWSKPETAFRSDDVTDIQGNQKRTIAGGYGMSKDLMFTLDNTYSSTKPNLDLTTAIP